MEESIESAFKVKKGSSLRDKPWIVLTFVLGLLVVILLLGNVFNITGNAVSGNKAGQALVDFAVAQGIDAQLVDVESEGSLYKVTILIEEEEYPYYVTKDGKYFLLETSLIPLTTEDTSTDTTDTTTGVEEIPKLDKPVVELYVFTYCPYGTQAEKGILPVVELLGDKIDFKIRQIGAMHGDYEKVEAERQLCIEKEYPTKFLDYVLEFALNSEVGVCGGNATCVNPLINSIYTKLGISESKINSCMASDGLALYNAEVSNSQTWGISGSPTLVINGIEVQTDSSYKNYVINGKLIPFSRSAETYKEVICELFTTTPSECSQTLSTESPSAGFGASSSGTSSGSC